MDESAQELVRTNAGSPGTYRQLPAAVPLADLPAATVIYFSERLRGKTIRLSANTYRIVGPEGSLIEAAPQVTNYTASLHRAFDSYELVVRSDQTAFVNGEAVRNVTLKSDDLIEIKGGPVLRFRVYPPHQSPSKNLVDILSDCSECARRDGRRWWHVLPDVMLGAVRDISTQTSRRFRAITVATLMLLGLVLSQAVWRSGELSEQLSREQERIHALESAANATGSVIANASPSVIFLQGSYGFLEPESGRLLRFIPGPFGEPLRQPDGRPYLTLDEDGELLEIEFSGTAFVVGENGLLMTNRHVAMPWESRSEAINKTDAAKPLRGILYRMQGFMSGAEDSFGVVSLRVSDNADLALLQGIGAIIRARRPLALAQGEARPGEQAILLGYPTGLRALLARAPDDFLEALPDDRRNSLSITNALAKAQLINPLASRGIIGQVSRDSIVYDAQTTSGGSGGPLLSMRGDVVAINRAILPEYGGSNLGVPAAQALQLMKAYQDGLQPSASRNENAHGIASGERASPPN